MILQTDINIPAGNAVPLDYISGNFPVISTFKTPEIQEICEITDELFYFFLVKQVKCSILQPLVHVFSLSLKTVIVPEDLKIASYSSV